MTTAASNTATTSTTAAAPSLLLDAHSALAARVNAVRKTTPLVHCLTNTVVQNITANALLAAGAAPAMVDHPVEAEEFAKVASAVLINVGTMSRQQVESMPLAARTAHDNGTPWVLDPVAVGGLSIRTKLAAELLELKPTAIRGNASEVQALAGMGAGGRGVDATDSVESALNAARDLAERTGAVVAVSGERDLIVWEHNGTARAVLLTSGTPMLTRVIGTGCALGALTAAYLGVAALEDAGEKAAAVLAAHAHVGAAGTEAARTAEHPGSYGVAWIDALDSLSAEQVASRVSVTEVEL